MQITKNKSYDVMTLDRNDKIKLGLQNDGSENLDGRSHNETKMKMDIREMAW